jgi:2-methylcitrate dehydratase
MVGNRTWAETMAQFTFALRYDTIPGEVLVAARRHLADTLACALAAYDMQTVLALRQRTVEHAGSAAATIIGSANRVAADAAAMVNGVMVRFCDANDIFVLPCGGASGHFSDGTAALLALAQQHRRTGEELLTCLVASYELQGAMADSIEFWSRGLHPLTNAAWVVPIAAARIAGGTPAQAVHACAIAAASSTVWNTWIKPGPITTLKSIAPGLVGRHIVEAVELALLGVTGPKDSLETLTAFPPGSQSPGECFEQLGQRWSMTRNMLKLYPAQVNTQAAVEAVIRLRERGVEPEQIERLVLYGHRGVCAGVQGFAAAFSPESREAADHSTPFVMALALLHGRLTPQEYEGEPWTNAPVKEILKKIKLIIDPERDRGFCEQSVLGVRLMAELRDGRTEEVIVHQPKGHPEAPLTEAELLQKFNWLIADVAPALKPERLLDLCMTLSTAKDLEAILQSCKVEQP